MKHQPTDAALVALMTQRAVDRACEGGDENEHQLHSSESCPEFYGLNHLEEWCDMCVFGAAINSIREPDPVGVASPQSSASQTARRMISALKMAHETLNKRSIGGELCAGNHDTWNPGWIAWMERRKHTLDTIEDVLREVVAPPSSSPQPRTQVAASDSHGEGEVLSALVPLPDAATRLTLNAYGRQCFDAGHEAASLPLTFLLSRLEALEQDWRTSAAQCPPSASDVSRSFEECADALSTVRRTRTEDDQARSAESMDPPASVSTRPPTGKG